MITAIRQRNLFFSRQDVADAEWIINSDASLNHGVVHLLWAWKVINWYLNMYQKVKATYTFRVRQGIKTTIQEVTDYIVGLIKDNKVLV